MQTECGYMPDQIRAMTLQDVDRLFKHWSRHPPPGALLAAIAQTLGIKISPPDQKQYMTEEAFRAVVQATQQGRTLGIANG